MLDKDWRVEIIDYITNEKLPTNETKAVTIARRSRGYVLVEDNLYKRGSHSGVLMKCIPREDGKELLEEIHSGVCGNHAASRTLVGKAFRVGFYWPTALKDAELLVKQCKKCQFFEKQTSVPAHNLITIPPSWPFACWGLDMIGPLTKAPGGFTYVLVALDKFTKWIEYKPVTTQSADRVVEFFCNMLYRFGIPNTIITDLGCNFTSDTFLDFCKRSAIDIKYVSIAHPRANGQVEQANGMILEGLKKRLYEANSKKGGKWISELPHVIWGLRIQPCKSTG